MWHSIEVTSFLKEIEEIWDEIAHISRKGAYEMELGTLSFISRYQKSTQMPAEIRLLEGVHSPCKTADSRIRDC